MLDFINTLKSYTSFNDKDTHWRSVSAKGIFIGKSKGLGVLSIFFRPVGFKFDGRDDNIRDIMSTSLSNLSKIRFQVIPCTSGPGAGGLEIYAFQNQNKPLSKMEVLFNIRHPGENMGSIGWIPKELLDIKSLIESYPNYITHFSFPFENGEDIQYPSLYLSLTIKDIPESILYTEKDELSKTSLKLLTSFDLVYERTNLKRWVHSTFMNPCWYYQNFQSDF